MIFRYAAPYSLGSALGHGARWARSGEVRDWSGTQTAFALAATVLAAKFGWELLPPPPSPPDTVKKCSVHPAECQKLPSPFYVVPKRVPALRAFRGAGRACPSGRGRA